MNQSYLHLRSRRKEGGECPVRVLALDEGDEELDVKPLPDTERH